MNAHIERLNYYNDPRTSGASTAPILYTDDDTEIELPTIWIVCPVCQGAGKYVNPSIDCGGLTADDFAEDPAFADDYVGGLYDVQCNHCAGRTTVQEVDWKALSFDQAEAYKAQLQDEADDKACCIAELAAGA